MSTVRYRCLVFVQAVAAMLCGCAAARADVLFGYRRGSPNVTLEFSRSGRFFTTSDFADIGNDWGLNTRARTTGGPGRFPKHNQPWTSDGSRTLFGLQFDAPVKPKYPGQFDQFPDGIPRFSRAVIQWKENVPAPSTWAACIRRPDGTLVRVETNAQKPLYPFDRSTLLFEPTAMQTLLIGLKGREDGIVNYADVEDIRLYLPPERASLTNRMAVWHPGFYLAVFHAEVPGMIEGITPVNAFCASHHTFHYHGGNAFDLFLQMAPFLTYKGASLTAVSRDYPVTSRATEEGDVVDYTLTFEVPGEAPVDLAVTSIFRTDADRSLEFRFQADALPPGVQLGYRFHGPSSVFGELNATLPTASGQPVSVATPAGAVTFQVEGGSDLVLVRETGSRIGWDRSDEKIRFETLASGTELVLTVSLPIGAVGRPRPEVLRYAWRPSLAGEGEEGIAPFKASDLELLDTINCGDPDDPHPCFDLSNDPVLETLRKKHGTLQPRAGQQQPYGYLGFLENPGEGAIPVTSVLGQPCREIPNKFGVYFRYNLNTHIRPWTVYLVVIEHAFDQLRRGEFHTIQLDRENNWLHGSLLSGGFETSGVAANEYRTESVLGYFPLKRWAGTNSVSSIVFSGVYSDGGRWESAPGPAIKSIRIYRVKTMPALPDIAALAPPPAQRRTLRCLTELCDTPNPLWLFEYPRLVGYDGVWTYHDPMSRFLGGSSSLRRSFHPGTLAGNRQLFEAAQGEGLFVNLHLGQLLNLGFGDGDDDSFTGAFHGSYNGDSVPFKPTREELAHIAKALSVSLPALAEYSSLNEVSLGDNPQLPCVWTERNLRDFCADTGATLVPSPHYTENAHALLKAGPDVVRAWMRWACAERFRFHQWLLDEVRQYRPDLYLVLCRTWYKGVISVFTSPNEPAIRGVTREQLEALGIVTYADFLNFMGIDPDLYAGKPGFSMEIEVNQRISSPELRRPSFYGTDWFHRMKDDFKSEGLSVMVNFCYEEHSKPLRAYSTLFVRSREFYRKGLIEALLQGNARNITLPTYNEPWSGRIDDLRAFAVPYRLLPYASPEPYEGTVTDSASQAVIFRYGNRFGLFNAGGLDTVVELGLPPGCTSVTDLSDGVPQALGTHRNRDGNPGVGIPMPPWSLRTLEMPSRETLPSGGERRADRTPD